MTEEAIQKEAEQIVLKHLKFAAARHENVFRCVFGFDPAEILHPLNYLDMTVFLAKTGLPEPPSTLPREEAQEILRQSLIDKFGSLADAVMEDLGADLVMTARNLDMMLQAQQSAKDLARNAKMAQALQAGNPQKRSLFTVVRRFDD